MKKVIFCNPEKCNGCQICEVVCSSVKEHEINPLLSRIRLVRIDPLVQMALPCQLCDKTPCVASCPEKAIRVSQSGVIEIDNDKCIFCGWCLHSCPFGAIMMNSRTRWIKICDLCEGEPKCVEHCPKEALLFATREEVTQRIRKGSIGRLMDTLSQ